MKRQNASLTRFTKIEFFWGGWWVDLRLTLSGEFKKFSSEHFEVLFVVTVNVYLTLCVLFAFLQMRSGCLLGNTFAVLFLKLKLLVDQSTDKKLICNYCILIIDKLFVFFQAKVWNITLFQLLNSENLLLFFVLCYSKLMSLGFRLLVAQKQADSGRHLEV